MLGCCCGTSRLLGFAGVHKRRWCERVHSRKLAQALHCHVTFKVILVIPRARRGVQDAI